MNENINLKLAIKFTKNKINKSPIIFDNNGVNNKIYYEGMIGKTTEGYTIKIIKYINWEEVYIEFLDGEFPCIKRIGISDFNTGKIRYPYKRNKYGGYMGEGIYNAQPPYNYIYDCWRGMFIRILKHTCYKNFTIHEDWFNFQNFADWYINTQSQLNPNYKYELDKDILQWNNPYKIYGPDTCCLVPHNVNICLSNMQHPSMNGLPLGVRPMKSKIVNKFSAFLNTPEHAMKYLGSKNSPEEAFNLYKDAKKEYIISIANYYYKENAISKKVYIALINIEILPYPNIAN